MYYPYIALIWDQASRSQSEVAAQLIELLQRGMRSWNCRLRGPGAAVFDLPPSTPIANAYALHGQRGVVYGQLFDRHDGIAPSPDKICIDQAFADACASSGGVHLIRNYWGSYVAIVLDTGSRHWVVIRDCSGMVPCYYSSVSGVTVAFSSIALATPCLPRHRINWPYVASFLAWPSIQVRQTGLQDVYELLAGESLSTSGNRLTTRFAWDPILFCRDGIDNPETAATELGRAAQSVISSWAGVHRTVLHSLSGGFDSSLVLSLLARSACRPVVTCVNRFGDGAAEDERRYARISAKACNTELLESPWNTTRIFDDRCLDIPMAAKPGIPYLLRAIDAEFWNQLAAQTGSDSVWSGQGGDHLFISFKTELGALDCFRLHGPGRELGHAIRNASSLTGRSYLNLIIKSAAISVSGRALMEATRMVPNPRFLTGDCARSVDGEQILHPWYSASRGLPPGKRFHLLQIADVINRHWPMPGMKHIEEVHPLISQPLLETCLRIPVHILLRHGKTRGLARDAFSAHLPREILSREQKGQTGSHYLGLLRRSRRFITDLLSDGLVVSQGLIARDALLDTLENDEPIRSETFYPLFACVAAEIWARQATDRPRELPTGERIPVMAAPALQI